MADKKDNKIKFIVITPYQCFFEGKVSSVTLPTIDGEMGIMLGHSPLVVALKPGICTVRIDNEKKYFTVSEGYAEIGQKIVMIVCDSAEWPEDIVVKQISESYKAALEAKDALIKTEGNNPNKYVFKEVEQRIMRAKARIKLVELYGNETQKHKLVSLGLVKGIEN